MKYFGIFFLSGLILLGGCEKKKEGEFQLYEFRVFLMEGSRLQEEPTLPLFPGEIAVQFLETAITDMEEIQEQLEKTFGYRQINFVGMKYFLFSEIISSSNNGLLDSAAIQSARQYTFYPGEVNGKPVKVRLAIPFKFKLK